MGLYNVIFGRHGSADAILGTLGLTQADCGRFRDCGVANGEIYIYTRNGGGNREAYQDTIDELAKHPNYLRDKDDDFDNTYATIYFSFPAEYAEQLKAIDEGTPFDPDQRWKDMLNSLKGS